MRKTICAVIATILSIAPQTAMAQTGHRVNPSTEHKTIRYDSCGFLDGFNTGLSLGIALLDPRTRRCVLEHKSNGYFVHPDGEYKCTITVKDGEYTNRNCPTEVFKQLQ